MDGFKLYAKMEAFAHELGSEIHYDKTQSRLMRIISKILFFNKGFLERFTTTIFKDIYLSHKPISNEDHVNMACVIAHELVHVIDFIKKPIRFTLGYLFPQILFLLVFITPFAFLNIQLLWFLLAFVFLAPIPSPGRAEIEVRGYSMSMAIRWWTCQYATLEYERFFPRFTGPDYYFMWPFEKNLTKRFKHKKNLIFKGRLDSEINIASRIHQIVLECQ